MGNRLSLGKVLVHALLIIYAAILAYILAGLIFKFTISADIFFDLSFALLFFALGQSFYELGFKRAILFLGISSVIGFLAEVLGTTTGFPFGKYYYTDFLGPKVFGVPEVVPLVWFVISYLTLSIAYGAFRGREKVLKEQNRKWSLLNLALLAAFGAVAWDFLIDPMFSSYGYWVWTGQFFPLPEVDGIPLTNFVGWFVLVTLMLSAYFAVVSRRSAKRQTLLIRHNTFDSQVAYILLIIDGTVANWSLGHFFVIAIGVPAMLAFLFVSYYAKRASKNDAKEIISNAAAREDRI